METVNVMCACGASYDDVAALAKVGWLRFGGGSWGLFVRCARCLERMCTEILRDAAQCDGCHELIVGSRGDMHVCTPVGTFHATCARRANVMSVGT